MTERFRKVFTDRLDKLGSVLKNLAHAWRYACAHDARLVCNWPKYHTIRGAMPFRDIFQWPQNDDPFDLEEGEIILPDDCIRAEDLASKEQVRTATNILYHPTKPLLMPGENIQQVECEARKLMRKLRPRPEINDAIMQIKSRIDLNSYVAVHIRQTDDVNKLIHEGVYKHRPKLFNLFAVRYADINSYISAIEANVPDASLFVFSNSKPQIAALKNSLVGRHIFTMDDFADLQKYLQPSTSKQHGYGLSTQCDFLEMMIMAETKCIIGSNSNFSKFAQLLGNNTFLNVQQWLTPPTMIENISNVFPDPEVAGKIFNAYAKIMKRHGRTDAAEIFLSYINSRSKDSP